MIDASLGKTGSALILLLRGHGWRPQPRLLSRQISEQQQTQSVKCWIYSPLCATTCQQEHLLSCSSLKPGSEARLRAWSFSAGRADVNVCTGTQLWKEKSISCWDNLWRRSCTKSPLMMLWILLVKDIQAPVRISLHKQPNKFSFQNPSKFHQRQQLFNSLGHLNSQRYSKCKLNQKYSVWTLVIPELKLDPQTRALLHAG